MLLQHTLPAIVATQFAAAAIAAPPASEALATSWESVTQILPTSKPRSWESIVLHHSATTAGSVASIDAAHRQQKDAAGNPWLGIGYHFVVGNGQSMGDGEVQATFRWQQQLAGAHAGNRAYNDRGIGICLIGNFEETPPTDKQLASLDMLLAMLSTRYAISRDHILRHQDVHATLCPGRHFPFQQVVGKLSTGSTPVPEPARGGT
jgi:N-acetyl-anhydromuramyl-L-alanine amidase AmpD